MKRIKSTVTYKVPHWNFCNSDNLTFSAEVSDETCRFCIKDKTGCYCALYDTSLSVKDGMISKVRDCCKATAGFPSNIEPAEVPTIPPKDLMKQTIELYDKTVKDLMAQGYPQPIATATAKKYVLGGK